MQFTCKQLIFVVSNYLFIYSVKEDQQLFEQRFRYRVSQTKITILKNVKKCKTESTSLNLDRYRSGRRRRERIQKKPKYSSR